MIVLNYIFIGLLYYWYIIRITTIFVASILKIWPTLSILICFCFNSVTTCSHWAIIASTHCNVCQFIYTPYLFILPITLLGLRFNLQCITVSSRFACVKTRCKLCIIYSSSPFDATIKPSGLLNSSLANIWVVVIQFVLYSYRDRFYVNSHISYILYKLFFIAIYF